MHRTMAVTVRAQMYIYADNQSHTLNNARKETQTFENYLTFFLLCFFFFYRSAAFFFFAVFFCLFRYVSLVVFSAFSLILILMCVCVFFLCILIILIAHSIREQYVRVWPYSKWHRENILKWRRKRIVYQHTHTHTRCIYSFKWKNKKWVEKWAYTPYWPWNINVECEQRPRSVSSLLLIDFG